MASAVVEAGPVAAVRDLAGLVAGVVSRGDCAAARDLVADVMAGVEAGRPRQAGQPRPRVVRLLGEAVVHLSRGGVHVPVETVRRLASVALAEAAERMEAGA